MKVNPGWPIDLVLFLSESSLAPIQQRLHPINHTRTAMGTNMIESALFRVGIYIIKLQKIELKQLTIFYLEKLAFPFVFGGLP